MFPLETMRSGLIFARNAVSRQPAVVRDYREGPAEGLCPQRSCCPTRSGPFRQDSTQAKPVLTHYKSSPFDTRARFTPLRATEHPAIR